ncbi:MAG TPA: polysaccharide biosynthesis tyrosine autokinase [Solirubrobacteraceae bacterium]
MELRQYVRLLRAHWLLVVLAVVACTGAAALFAWTRTPTYAAQTQLFVSIGGVPADLSQAYQGGLFSQQRVTSYARLATSPVVTQAVIDQLGLTDDVSHLQGRIDASVPTDTVLIYVRAKDRSPRRARAIANAVGLQLSRFVNRLETSPDRRTPPVRLSVTGPARLPTAPASPRKGLAVALGVLVGLVLGIAAAVLREALDTRVRAGDDVEAITGAPLLASIAEEPEGNGRRLVVATAPLSVRAEAYRRLRTNLGGPGPGKHPGSVVVSSAVPREGKTLVAANLAIAFAQAGARVILVDADLRRPKLTELLELSSTPGLADVLTKHLPVEAALQTWRDDLSLQVLGSGAPPPAPGEVLASPRLAATVRALTERADVVILDAPALLPVTDAAILARAASGTILVARASTRTAQLESATQALRAVDAPVVGVVVNRLRFGTPLGGGRTVAAVAGAAAAAAGVAAWLALGTGDGGSKARTPSRPAPTLASVGRLQAIAAGVGHPVYWAGSLPGRRTELTREASGDIVIRYLTPRDRVGDPTPRFLTIVTHRRPDAFAATLDVGRAPGGTAQRLPDDGVVVTTRSQPTSAYFSRPGSPVQVEVDHPIAGRALQLVRAGRIAPISAAQR